MNQHFAQEASIPNSALEPFRVLIGNWNTTGSHGLVPNTILHGRTSFEWLEGGAFLLMRSEIDDSRFPQGIAIIGSDNTQEECYMLTFDERGVSRKHEVSLHDNIWKWWRNAPGFFQRYEGTIVDGGNTIIGKGEISKHPRDSRGHLDSKGEPNMTKLRVDFFSISLDGYGAGPNQSFENPLGVGGESLHDWFVVTRSFRQMTGQDEGETGIDNDFAERGTKNLGAFIMGRNMFGPPQGGDWADDSWKGWWGDNPPYHGPVFVLTHFPRASVAMEGGTTFHFVTDGIHAALKRATEAANGKDIRLAGGVATIRQYLQAGLIDQLHIPISPVILGTGESLFSGIDLLKLGYVVTEHVPTAKATHVVLTKRK